MQVTISQSNYTFVDVSNWLEKLDRSYENAKASMWNFAATLAAGIDQFGRTDPRKMELYELASQQVGLTVRTLQTYVSAVRSPVASLAIDKDLSFQHARAVLGLEPDIADDLLSQAVAHGWTPEQTSREAWIQKNNASQRTLNGTAATYEAPEVDDVPFSHADLTDGTRYAVVIVAQGPKQIVEESKKIRAKKTKKRREERKARNEELCSEPPALIDLPSRFDLVYADPPWRYEFNQTDNRVIENQYPTMALEDICAMPVSDITIQNAVLFLWATLPKLEEALQVVNAWGFKYRTAIVWDKVRMGQGIYTRQQTELLLIAIKGNMYSPESNYAGNFRSLVSIERSQNHSEKPKEFYGIIEGLYPDCTKVELFARNKRDGWFSWGNQA